MICCYFPGLYLTGQIIASAILKRAYLNNFSIIDLFYASYVYIYQLAARIDDRLTKNM